MAGRNVKSNASSFDPVDKMHSNTLKRHPKMDLSRNDLLQLLGYLEGELQARDVVIATLKAEKAKQLLYQAKYGRFGLGDPFSALQRDSDNMKDTAFDEMAIKSMYDNQLAQLENLIATQRKAQLKMREQLVSGEKRYHKVCSELDDEKRKHAQDTAQGDDVTYMLEKERERLKQEVDFEKANAKKLEKDLKKTLASLEEERASSAKHKQVALMLIKERKKLVEKMLLDRQRYGQAEKLLNDEKNKTMNMAEGLMQESKKSLKMEATLEKQLSEFDLEREQLKNKLAREENRNKDLQTQMESLKWQLENLQKQLMEKSSKDVFQSIEIKSSATSTPPKTDRTRNASSPVSGTPSAAQLSSKVINKPTKSSVESSVEREAGLSPRHVIYSSDVGLRKGTRFGSPQPVVIEHGGVQHLPGAGSEVVLEPRVAPVGAVSEKSLKEGYQSQKLSVSVGSGPTVITPGGRISVQAGGGHVTLSSGPTSPRKLAAVGRGVPPPIPPNKPVLMATTTAPSKPSPPPKVGLTATPKGSLGSGELVKATGSPHGVKSVQIPVSVVHTAGSPGSTASRVPKREGSPSTVRKPTQFSDTSQGHLRPRDPSEENALSLSSNPAFAANVPDSFDFLGPEMADLQQLLSAMVTDSNTVHVEGVQSPSTSLPTTTYSSSSSLIFSSPLSSTSIESLTSPIHKYSSQGNADALRKLIVDLDADVNLPMKDGTTPAHCAAEHGKEDCLKLLLERGANVNSLRDDKMSALHIAAGNGHLGCLKILLTSGGNVHLTDHTGLTPLHWAASGGHQECCRALLDRGARLNAFSNNNWSPLHCATHAGCADCLKLLLTYQTDQSEHSSEGHAKVLQEVASVVDKEGSLLPHLAAKNESQNCLSVMLQYCDIDMHARDTRGRSILDVASKACQTLLLKESFSSVRTVPVELKCSGLAYEQQEPFVIGTLEVSPYHSWQNIDNSVQDLFRYYTDKLDKGLKTKKTSRLDPETNPDVSLQYSLGFSKESIQSFSLGPYSWVPGGKYPTTLPKDIMCNNNVQNITVTLNGSHQSCDSLAFDLIFPISVIQNYLRLLDQYRCVVFYGPEGSRKKQLIKRLGRHISSREVSQGRESTMTQVYLTEQFSHTEFIQLLKEKGCMVPLGLEDNQTTAPILLLFNMEKIRVAEVFGSLLEHMEHRGDRNTFTVTDEGGVQNVYHFTENFYLIAAMDKARSTGLDLSIQQRFRWVNFRIDVEPVRNLLARCLLRRLIHTYQGRLPSQDDPVFKAVEWVVCVWQRLNDGLAKLGLPDVIFGPDVFLPCPLELQDSHTVFDWLKKMWNEVISPVVRLAVLKGTGKEPSSTPGDGQQKVANTALFVLMQRAIVPGCPLSGDDKESYLSQFAGSNELEVSLKADKTSPGVVGQRRPMHVNGSPRSTPSEPSRSRPKHRYSSGVDGSDIHNISHTGPSVKRRSLSETSLSRTDTVDIPVIRHDSASELQSKVPKLEIRSPVLGLTVPLPKAFTPAGSAGSVNSHTGTSEPEQSSSVMRSRIPQPTGPSKRSRSSENVSSVSQFQVVRGSNQFRPTSPFSFSLTTPTSSLFSFKFMDSQTDPKKSAFDAGSEISRKSDSSSSKLTKINIVKGKSS